MKQISFVKLSGAGNDFVLIDTKINRDLNLSSEEIQRLCDRRKGIGADGLILISDIPGYSFDMKYFNSDGSTGSLCGNGARCALRYASNSGRINGVKSEFKANGLDYSGQILDDGNIKFVLNGPKDFKYNFKIKAAGQLISASYINTGSPHVVIKITDVLEDPSKLNSFYKNIDAVPVYNLGKEIRYSPDFSPGGVNVNFIQYDNDIIKIRTYERGVENETLACGTGSVAAAIVSFVNDNLKLPIKLKVKSGDILTVDFIIENQKIKDLSLTGPAVVVFNGEFTI